MTIYLQEHMNSGYSSRTQFNAENSDLTIAFTVDEFTAGERLTRKFAAEDYGRIDLKTTTPAEAARNIHYLIDVKLCGNPCGIINIAGNGLATLSKYKLTQESVNKFLVETFLEMKNKWNCFPEKGFRSGGQTGVDIAAAVVAEIMGVDAMITFPKGYLQRNAKGVDFTQTKESVMQSIFDMTERQKSSMANSVLDIDRKPCRKLSN